MSADPRWKLVTGADRTDGAYCDFCGTVAKASVRLATGTIKVKDKCFAIICARCVAEITSAMIQDAERNT